MKSLESFEKDLLICNHCRCGFCREECPAYRATRIEGVSPKGRMEILQGYYEGFIEPSEKLYKRLSLCARCSDCYIRCPIQKNNLIERFDVKVDPCEATDAVLANLVRDGCASDSILSTKENVVKGHNLFRQSNKDRDKWMDSMEELPPDRYRREHAEVLYFVGCISSFPAELRDIAVAFTRILEKSGTDFAILGEEEWCCGALPKTVGLVEEVEELKAHNIEQVRKLGATTVVFNCPTCYAMWATEYKLDGVKLMHSTQFIEERKTLDKLAHFLGNVVDAWKEATQEQRNKLASALFEQVWIEHNRVVGVKPREELKPFFQLSYEEYLKSSTCQLETPRGRHFTIFSQSFSHIAPWFKSVDFSLHIG